MRVVPKAWDMLYNAAGAVAQIALFSDQHKDLNCRVFNTQYKYSPIHISGSPRTPPLGRPRAELKVT
jgi:hypothetical protein